MSDYFKLKLGSAEAVSGQKPTGTEMNFIIIKLNLIKC